MDKYCSALFGSGAGDKYRFTQKMWEVEIGEKELKDEAFFNKINNAKIPVLLFSLVESKLILPAHMQHISMRTNIQKSKLKQAQASLVQQQRRTS